MSTCSICLNEVRTTRKNPPLRCGHVFHSFCIQEWKNKGKNNCPICRKVIDGSKYSVTITIQNNDTSAESNVSLTNESIFNVLDITAELDTIPSLESFLSDFGVSLADFDATILDTE